MGYLHSDKSIFKEAIDLTAYQNSCISAAVEKDYYITMVIKMMSEYCPETVLCGEAALSKCGGIIGRLPETVSYTSNGRIGTHEREQILDAIGNIARTLKLRLIYDSGEAEDFTGCRRSSVCMELQYDSLCDMFCRKGSFRFFLEEISEAAAAFISELQAECIICEMMRKEAPQYAAECGLGTFKVRARDMEYILAEKIFDICDNHILKRIKNNSADIYDVYMLLPLVDLEKSFALAASCVRTERAGRAGHPSADSDADISELLYGIVKEEIYKQDYNDMTLRIIDNAVSYDDAVSALYAAADSKAFSLQD